MQTSLKNARRLQAAFLVLLVVCVAQVGWWIIDQWMHTAEDTARTEEFYRQSLAASETLAQRGLAPGAIVRLFPEIIDTPDGFAIDPRVLAELENERRSRVNQYAWEGGFFLVVLVAAIGVVASAVRSERRLRRRQHNFVTAVTHELKSPLAAMRLAAETLELRDGDAEIRQRQVRRLLASLERMESTVANVLDTARIDEDKLHLEANDVNISQAIRELVEELGHTADSRGVGLRTELPDRLVVHADPHALNAVLRNLIDNALGAVANTDDGLVTVSARADSACAVVEVSDNGRGFDPASAGKLFEKFYRPGDEMRREKRGTGLGLYIARQLAIASGARLVADSDGPGRGATFTLRWPLATTPR